MKIEHDRQQQALQVLRGDDHRDRVEARDEHDQRAQRQDERVDPEEDRRVAERLADARLPAERLADHVGGADRHDRRREHGRPEEPDREQRRRERPGDGLEASRRVRRAS